MGVRIDLLEQKCITLFVFVLSCSMFLLLMVVIVDVGPEQVGLLHITACDLATWSIEAWVEDVLE